MSKIVNFNGQKRELCEECGFPEGFCRHTIEEEYADEAPETPVSDREAWQTVRSLAIERTVNDRLARHLRKLRREVDELARQNKELRTFRNQVKDMLSSELYEQLSPDNGGTKKE